MKTAISYMIAILLGAAICFMLMRGWQQNKTAVDSAAQVEVADKKAALAEVDRLRGDSMTQADVIDNQARQLAWYEAQLGNTGQEIGATITTMDSIRIIHDTVAFVVSCDTLEDQVKQARVQIRGFRLATDSLIDAYQAQGRIKDSAAQVFRSAFLHADSTGNFYLNQYNTLYKQQKRSILTEKVLGITAGVLLLGLLIKK